MKKKKSPTFIRSFVMLEKIYICVYVCFIASWVWNKTLAAATTATKCCPNLNRWPLLFIETGCNLFHSFNAYWTANLINFKFIVHVWRLFPPQRMQKRNKTNQHRKSKQIVNNQYVQHVCLCCKMDCSRRMYSIFNTTLFISCHY